MSISKHDIIADVLQKNPESMDLFLEFGLHCIGCGGAAYESVEDGCLAHGMSSEIIDELVCELNELHELNNGNYEQ